ncbi:MAG: ECF transporter S component [Clostridia bacterium]|nr:ECF transporter S component [Clostridia bacterium]
MKNHSIRKIAYIGVLSALAAVAMVIKFPVPWAPAFYKMEFSEVICLIGGFILGAPAAIAIEFVKIMVNFLLDGTTTAGIGEISNFLMGCSFVVPATIIFRRKRTIQSAIAGVAIGTGSLIFVSCVLNYFLLIPTYAKVFGIPMSVIIGMGSAIFSSVDGLLSFVLTCVLTFNFSKGVISAILGVLLFKYLPSKVKKI